MHQVLAAGAVVPGDDNVGDGDGYDDDDDNDDDRDGDGDCYP